MDLGVLAQYGALGIFSILLVIFARGAYRRETEGRDAEAAEVKRLNDFIQTKVVEALTTSTEALKNTAELLDAMQAERQEYLPSPRGRARRNEGP